MPAPTSKPWADHPFALLPTPRSLLHGAPESPASRNATEMALIHNIILRGLNSIYVQAPQLIFSEDIDDFMSFCDAWSCTLHSHHTTEETVYFPLLESMCSKERKGVELQNHKDHETFLPGLAQFDEFVAKVKESDGNVPYDSTKLIAIIDGFGHKLATHLRNEIELLESLQSDERIDWSALGKEMAARSKKVADRFREVPFIITNADNTYEGGIHGPRFPPFPYFVHQIFRWVYVPQFKEAWKFSCCDDYGVPRELPFV